MRSPRASSLTHTSPFLCDRECGSDRERAERGRDVLNVDVNVKMDVEVDVDSVRANEQANVSVDMQLCVHLCTMERR